MCGVVGMLFSDQCLGPCVWWPEIASDFISGSVISRPRSYELRSFRCATLFISQISKSAMGLRDLLWPLALKHERSWRSESFMGGVRGLEKVPPRGHPVGTTRGKHVSGISKPLLCACVVPTPAVCSPVASGGWGHRRSSGSFIGKTVVRAEVSKYKLRPIGHLASVH